MLKTSSSSSGVLSILRILYSYLISTDLFSGNYFRFINRFRKLQFFLIINLSFATPLVNCKRGRERRERYRYRERERERERETENERETEKERESVREIEREHKRKRVREREGEKEMER